MRFLISILVLVSVAASAGSTAANFQSLNETQRQVDEYGVYDAVIGVMFADHKATFANGNNDVDLLLIESRTGSQELPKYFPSTGGDFKKVDPAPTPEPFRIVLNSRKVQSREAAEREALDDYSYQNMQPATLRRLFNLKVDYALIGGQETNSEALAQDGKQARGIVTFSRVGFNRARTQAVVYMAYSRYMCCGWGYSIFLVKEHGMWKVDKKRQLWVGIS